MELKKDVTHFKEYISEKQAIFFLSQGLTLSRKLAPSTMLSCLHSLINKVMINRLSWILIGTCMEFLTG